MKIKSTKNCQHYDIVLTTHKGNEETYARDIPEHLVDVLLDACAERLEGEETWYNYFKDEAIVAARKVQRDWK